MVILKGIVLLVCTGMVVGMYSNYVTSVVAKTKRRVMVDCCNSLLNGQPKCVL